MLYCGLDFHLSLTEVHDESHCTHVENDIGLFTGAAAVNLTTERRVSLLHDVFWSSSFGRWHWLCYSKEQSGAFCKFCVLFSPCGGGVGCQPLGRLVTTTIGQLERCDRTVWPTWEHLIPCNMCSKSRQFDGCICWETGQHRNALWSVDWRVRWQRTGDD